MKHGRSDTTGGSARPEEFVLSCQKKKKNLFKRDIPTRMMVHPCDARSFVCSGFGTVLRFMVVNIAPEWTPKVVQEKLNRMAS